MKRLAYRLAPVGLALVTVSLAGVFSDRPVNAQIKSRITNPQPSPKGLSAGEGQERLLLDKDWSKDNTELRQLQELRKGAALAKAGEVLDHAAQWYAYRLTHTEYQEPKPSSPGMHDLVRQAADQLIDLRDPRKPATRAQQEYMKEFGNRLTARLHEVVKNPKIIARVNAAILLARLAKAGQEDAVDVLVEVIQDPKESDAVKLYALRGLKDFFVLGRGESPFNNKEREARVIAALLEYVLHRPALPKEAAPDEVAAVSYVRSEAIEALGQSLSPAGTKILAKTTQLERPTALVLLRVLRKDRIQPEPSLGEQVAAAAALCQLHSKEVDQYNPDYVAYHLGRFLVEFVSQCNGRGDEKKDPWKIYAHHLSNGLEVMNVDLANPPASPHATYLAELTKQASRLLEAIQKNTSEKPSPNDLSAWLDQHPPKSQMVYKGMPEAVVNEGDKAAGG